MPLNMFQKNNRCKKNNAFQIYDVFFDAQGNKSNTVVETALGDNSI